MVFRDETIQEQRIEIIIFLKECGKFSIGGKWVSDIGDNGVKKKPTPCEVKIGKWRIAIHRQDEPTRV